MNKACQDNMTIKEYLDSEGIKPAELVKRSGIDRRIVHQAMKAGHLLKINSLGEYCLVPATYARAFI